MSYYEMVGGVKVFLVGVFDFGGLLIFWLVKRMFDNFWVCFS